jgi:SNF2 family DNA or RNA helicase
MEMLEPLIAEGRRVLVFSQFVQMLRLIEADVKARGWDYAWLTGETRNREEVVAKFQEGNAPLFLISLKAGGVGLTLTAADKVILYDPWWNPAAERQAGPGTKPLRGIGACVWRSAPTPPFFYV